MTKNKSADGVFVFENNVSKHSEIDKWRIGLHVIWQTTKMDSIWKVSHFKWREFT